MQFLATLFSLPKLFPAQTGLIRFQFAEQTFHRVVERSDEIAPGFFTVQNIGGHAQTERHEVTIFSRMLPKTALQINSVWRELPDMPLKLAALLLPLFLLWQAPFGPR